MKQVPTEACITTRGQHRHKGKGDLLSTLTAKQNYRSRELDKATDIQSTVGPKMSALLSDSPHTKRNYKTNYKFRYEEMFPPKALSTTRTETSTRARESIQKGQELPVNQTRTRYKFKYEQLFPSPTKKDTSSFILFHTIPPSKRSPSAKYVPISIKSISPTSRQPAASKTSTRQTTQPPTTTSTRTTTANTAVTTTTTAATAATTTTTMTTTPKLTSASTPQTTSIASQSTTLKKATKSPPVTSGPRRATSRRRRRTTTRRPRTATTYEPSMIQHTEVSRETPYTVDPNLLLMMYNDVQPTGKERPSGRHPLVMWQAKPESPQHKPSVRHPAVLMNIIRHSTMSPTDTLSVTFPSSPKVTNFPTKLSTTQKSNTTKSQYRATIPSKGCNPSVYERVDNLFACYRKVDYREEICRQIQVKLYCVETEIQDCDDDYLMDYVDIIVNATRKTALEFNCPTIFLGRPLASDLFANRVLPRLTKKPYRIVTEQSTTDDYVVNTHGRREQSSNDRIFASEKPRTDSTPNIQTTKSSQTNSDEDKLTGIYYVFEGDEDYHIEKYYDESKPDPTSEKRLQPPIGPKEVDINIVLGHINKTTVFPESVSSDPTQNMGPTYSITQPDTPTRPDDKIDSNGNSETEKPHWNEKSPGSGDEKEHPITELMMTYGSNHKGLTDISGTKHESIIGEVIPTDAAIEFRNEISHETKETMDSKSESSEHESAKDEPQVVSGRNNAGW